MPTGGPGKVGFHRIRAAVYRSHCGRPIEQAGSQLTGARVGRLGVCCASSVRSNPTTARRARWRQGCCGCCRVRVCHQPRRRARSSPALTQATSPGQPRAVAHPMSAIVARSAATNTTVSLALPASYGNWKTVYNRHRRQAMGPGRRSSTGCGSAPTPPPTGSGWSRWTRPWSGPTPTRPGRGTPHRPSDRDWTVTTQPVIPGGRWRCFKVCGDSSSPAGASRRTPGSGCPNPSPSAGADHAQPQRQVPSDDGRERLPGDGHVAARRRT